MEMEEMQQPRENKKSFSTLDVFFKNKKKMNI